MPSLSGVNALDVHLDPADDLDDLARGVPATEGRFDAEAHRVGPAEIRWEGVFDLGRVALHFPIHRPHVGGNGLAGRHEVHLAVAGGRVFGVHGEIRHRRLDPDQRGRGRGRAGQVRIARRDRARDGQGARVHDAVPVGTQRVLVCPRPLDAVQDTGIAAHLRGQGCGEGRAIGQEGVAQGQFGGRINAQREGEDVVAPAFRDHLERHGERSG